MYNLTGPFVLLFHCLSYTSLEYETVRPNATVVPAFTPAMLAAQYNVTFDTLVADCEGCVAALLESFPRFISQLTTIILEADYWKDLTPQGYVDYNMMITKLLALRFVVVEAFYHPCCHAKSRRTGAIPMYVLQKFDSLGKLFPMEPAPAGSTKKPNRIYGPCY